MHIISKFFDERKRKRIEEYLGFCRKIKALNEMYKTVEKNCEE
jgi:hypothetical protein